MTTGFVPDSPQPAQPQGFRPDPTPTPGFKPDAQQPVPKRPPPPPAVPNKGGFTPAITSVNPGLNAVTDYLTPFKGFGLGGVRPAFKAIVDGLANLGNRMGVYDFNKGHHYAPNDPHLDGRAMDVDTINGEPVGTWASPNVKTFVQQALDRDPRVRVGVPATIYKVIGSHGGRVFQDEPAHIHVELDPSSTAPGTPPAAKAAKGFKPDTSIPPMQESVSQGQTLTLGGVLSVPTTKGGHSALSELAGHQDLPFILANAQMRDANPQSGESDSIISLLHKPTSHVAQAWALYKKDPAAAMDEYGLGSPNQNRYMEQNYPNSAEGKFSSFMQRMPFLNAIYTFGGEMVNPMAWAEGELGGKAVGMGGQALRGTRAEQGAQRAATQIGMGSPLYGLSNRGGVEASQWAKGAIASLNAPHQLLHMESNPQMLQKIFGGMTPQEQSEIVRLSQGLKPNPEFFKQYEDLSHRAQLLRDDIKQVTAHQQRVGVLPPKRTFNADTYFPMKSSYDFGPQFELEEELRGGAGPGGGMGTAQHKNYLNLDEAIRSGHLDQEFLPANNYDTWRRQRLQRVAFEDAVQRAPASIRRDVEAADFHNEMGVPLSQPWQQNINHTVQETLDNWLAENHARYPQGHPERYDLNNNPNWVSAKNIMPDPSRSPALAKSMVAPELWEFLRGNNGLQKYISASGSMLPGQEQTFLGRYVAVMRNAIISNFIFHPAVNVAGNDAVARGLYNLGGPQWEAGGYAWNAAKSLATQAGLKSPESFVGGAKAYSDWLDRALKAGGVAEFGEPRTSALGGEYARVTTAPSKKWLDRADRALTRAGDFNRQRTFGQKGEQAFAVSLFKDAVEQGKMSDAKAGQVVRESLGDYYNFDPQSPWSTFFFFMPWLKGNVKFWANTLVKRPQYVTGTTHAIRNQNIAAGDPRLQSPYPANDFSVDIAGHPYTPPFVGRVASDVANTAGSLAKGDVLGAAQSVWHGLSGRQTPVTRTATDALTTLVNSYSGEVRGPETNYNMIANPKAPLEVQRQQIMEYAVGHYMPIPLVQYAVQDALRQGLTREDFARAVLGASGAGYVSDPSLTKGQKFQEKKAADLYKHAYNIYKYSDHPNDKVLRTAWDQYMRRLRQIGVIGP